MSMTSERTVVAAIGTPIDGLGGTTAAGVSWGAIIGGAVAAAGVSLVMVALGSGLGLTMVSPWSHEGVGPTTFAVSTAVWLIVMQWVASLFGGYLTGRLRRRLGGYRGDEVFFRDTAHGLLAWALATLLVAGLMTSAVGALIGGGTQAASSVLGVAAGAARTAADEDGDVADPTGYFADRLFRPASVPATAALPAVPATEMPAAPTGEAARILVAGLAAGEVPDGDRAYLARMVAERTGLPPQEAETRVAQVITDLQTARTEDQEAADAARKAGALLSMFVALSMVVGAFIASVAAALGGHHRDALDAA